MLDGLGHDAADNPLGLFDGVPDDVACRSNVVDQTDALSSERHMVFTTTGQDLTRDLSAQAPVLVWPGRHTPR
jgi:hypothetical protein